jgi:flotillin
MQNPFFLFLLGFIGLIIISTISMVLSRYKKCPSDKILVVYGKIGKDSDGVGRSSRCIHGGAAFIWPIVQHYEFLDLTPISIEVNLQNALSKQNIRVDVPSRFTVGISTEPTTMTNAAERLLGRKLHEIQELARDMIFGQLRLVIATMDIEEINSDRDKFLANVANNVESELKKVGLKLINVNVTDIKDESGYIEALGKEAAAKAINDAKKSVAEKNRDGSIGEANAERDERIQVATANADAVEGENIAKIKIANSEASRREREAEANKRATSAEKVQAAMALQEAYAAEQEAEKARASKARETKIADIIIPAEIDKEKVELDAEAEGARIRGIARGEADAKLLKMEAEARGIFEIMSKRAKGLEELVKSANNDPNKAVMLMIADKLPELIKLQVEAVKNLKIDKVTVWDSMGNDGQAPTTANFLAGMLKSLPPLQDIFKSAGMELPEYLAKQSEENSQEINAEKTEESMELAKNVEQNWQEEVSNDENIDFSSETESE